MIVRQLQAIVIIATSFAGQWIKPTDGRAADHYIIEVVDAEAGDRVPLVELETTSGRVFVTDSSGLITLQEPEWWGRPVWFHVRSHGYEYPADGFGFRGLRLTPTPGGRTRIPLRRINIAQRLCRLSGSGIFQHALKSGQLEAAPWQGLRAGITGYDSVQSASYKGRMYWFWGDTNLLNYPLGHFHMTGATTPLPQSTNGRSTPFLLFPESKLTGGTPPYWGLHYQYFVDDRGLARGTCQMPGDGPTWLDGLITISTTPDDSRLYGAYVKVRAPLTVYRRGLCQWDDDSHQFQHLQEIPVNSPAYPYGHPQIIKDGTQSWIQFGDPFPNVRVRASPQDFTNLNSYEGWTPLQPGTRWPDRKLEINAAGEVVYGWKPRTPPLTPAEERDAVATGLLPAKQACWQLYDADSHKFVEAHRGSVSWNHYRKCWILIATQIGGTSQLGEVWYGEAAGPQGPWQRVCKIVTHHNYSFYNPRHHREYDTNSGRYIHFEGTYTHTFSGNPQKTPDYDYNQILYRLDLADPRLACSQIQSPPHSSEAASQGYSR